MESRKKLDVILEKIWGTIRFSAFDILRQIFVQVG